MPLIYCSLVMLYFQQSLLGLLMNFIQLLVRRMVIFQLIESFITRQLETFIMTLMAVDLEQLFWLHS